MFKWFWTTFSLGVPDVPSYLKGLCHAIFYLFKKLKRVFELIEFQEQDYILALKPFPVVC